MRDADPVRDGTRHCTGRHARAACCATADGEERPVDEKRTRQNPHG